MPVCPPPLRPFVPRLAIVLALILTLPIVGRVGRPLAAQPAGGTLTLLHALPDVGTLAVFIDGRFIDGTLAYGRTVQADVPPSGTVRVVLAAAEDHASVVLDKPVELSPNGSTLAVIGGPLGSPPQPQIVAIDISPAGLEAGRSRLTFLNARPDPDPVVLASAAGGTFASSSQFMPSAAVTVEARSLALEAAVSAPPLVVATVSLDAEPVRSYALVLLSTGGDLPAPTLLVVAGPRGAAMPGTATAGAPGSVLVREDFSDPLRGILPSAAPPGAILQYGYSDGEYLLRNAGVETRSVAVPGEYANATIAVDARLLGEIDRRTVSVGCRFSADAGGNYGYRLRVEPGTGFFRFVREDGMRDTLLVNMRRSTAITRGLAVNRLELTCSGTTITGSINGVQVFSLQDSTYRSGPLTIGVGARAAGLTSEARFDNLVVTQR